MNQVPESVIVKATQIVIKALIEMMIEKPKVQPVKPDKQKKEKEHHGKKD